MEKIMSKINITRLIEKKTRGYRFTTIDKVQFESDSIRGVLVIDNFEGQLTLDLTQHTLEQLSEFIRYIKQDLDDEL
jgi:hypothetical protein